MDNKKRFLGAVTELRVLVVLLGFLTMALIDVRGATYYTAATGDIAGSIWSTSTNGTPGSLPTLVDGDIIIIDDNITITTNFKAWQNVLLSIDLNSTINISGEWWLSTNSVVNFLSSSAKVIVSGGGNSDKIKIGNSNTWSGNDGNLTGPGTLDKNFDPDTSPLPITLIFFKVAEQQEDVRLTWATASELNFDKFFVERSLEGNEFSEIGSMKGAGTSASRRDYAFNDKSPIVGRSYYRLKAVDYDGFTEYFGVYVCNYVGPKSIVIYPNPSQGEPINLILNFHPEEQSQIEIFNSIGVKLDQIFFSELTNDVKLPSGLKAGSYLIRFTSGSYSQVVRFSVF